MTALLEAPPMPLEPSLVPDGEPSQRRPRWFVVGYQREELTAWQFDSPTVDQDAAERRADELVTPPFMEYRATVQEFGGYAHTGPILFAIYRVTRQEQGKP